MSEINAAAKALAAINALEQLGKEYPQLRCAINAFLEGTTPPQMALLYELVHAAETKEAALGMLAGVAPLRTNG